VRRAFLARAIAVVGTSFEQLPTVRQVPSAGGKAFGWDKRQLKE